MKKFGALLLTLAMLLSLGACGKDETEPTIPEETAPVESATPAPTPTPTPEPTIAYSEESGETTADDGTVVLTYSYQLAQVDGVPGADKINAELQSRRDEFMSGPGSIEEYTDMAQTQYADWPDFFANGETYEMDYNVSASRLDDTVVSLSCADYTYSMGAHGYNGIFGLVFDAQTGDLLRLENLTGDVEALKDSLLQYITDISHDPDYLDEHGGEGAFFEGYEESLPTVVADGLWYFDETGMTLVANAYVLGPYAAGAFFFTVPYEDLANMIDAKWIPD